MPLAKPFMELSVFHLFIYTVKSFFFFKLWHRFSQFFCVKDTCTALFILFGCLRKFKNCRISCYSHCATFNLRGEQVELVGKTSAHIATPPNRVCVRRQIAKWQNGKWWMVNGEWGMATGNGEPCQRWRLSTLPSGFVTRCWLHFVNFHSFAVFTNLKICLRWLALAGEMEPVEFVGSPS